MTSSPEISAAVGTLEQTPFDLDTSIAKLSNILDIVTHIDPRDSRVLSLGGLVLAPLPQNRFTITPILRGNVLYEGENFYIKGQRIPPEDEGEGHQHIWSLVHRNGVNPATERQTDLATIYLPPLAGRWAKLKPHEQVGYLAAVTTPRPKLGDDLRRRFNGRQPAVPIQSAAGPQS